MDNRKLNLITAYEALAEQRMVVRRSLMGVTDDNAWLPPNSTGSVSPCYDAIESITRLCRFSDKNMHDPVVTGFFRVTREVATDINHFNDLKDTFKNTVADFKGRDANNRLLEGNRRILYKILDQALKFEGTGQATLTGTSLAELDLKTCYRKTRILDPSLSAINFMHETKHLRTHRITRAMLEAMVTKLHDEGNIGPYLEFRKTSDRYFAIAKNTSRRYIANLQYTDDTLETDTVPVSSVMIGTGTMPAVKWLEHENKTRKPRTGWQVNMNENFIPILSCYRYHYRENTEKPAMELG